MSRFVIYTTSLFLLLSFRFCFALNPVQEPIRSQLREGIRNTIRCEFDEADLIFKQIVKQYPGHPAGYFYLGANTQAMMLDREDFSSLTKFYTLMDKAIRLADSLKVYHLSDAWVYFYEGSAYLYSSFMKSKQGSWFSAYKDAKKGVQRLETAIERDSSLYDAYLGVGSFKYWKSARADFLLWLPFISDERETGIKMINQAIKNGHFIEDIGRDQLCWIMMDKGDYQKAVDLAEMNLKNFPQSRFFKWSLALASFLNGDLKKSYRIYAALLDEIKDIPEMGKFNEIECLLKMAQIKMNYKDYHEAYQFSDEILRMQMGQVLRKRVRHKLIKALEIRNESMEELNYK